MHANYFITVFHRYPDVQFIIFWTVWILKQNLLILENVMTEKVPGKKEYSKNNASLLFVCFYA